MKRVANREISKILYEIGEYLEMKGTLFKPRAYEKAGHSVENIEEEIYEIYKKGGLKAIENISGIGVSIAEKIEEIIKTGRLKYYDKIKKIFPVDVNELSAIESVGPKLIFKLYKALKIKNIGDLEKAARAGKIAKIPSLGKKTEEKILKGIEFLKESQGRFLLGATLPLARAIKSRLESLEGVGRVVAAGSIRRMQETIGDLDFLAIADNAEKIIDDFIKFPEVSHIYSQGKQKAMVRLKNGIDADLRILPAVKFGAALQYFTGDKRHNIALRTLAEKSGYKLNEYGLWRGKKLIAGKTEEAIYENLGMQTPPPEIRSDSGEIQAALKHELPTFVDYGDVKGDLQTTTNWTDGENSIEEMAEEAIKLGLEYVVITDHTKSLAMAGGLDEEKLLKQIAEIGRLNLKFENFPPSGGQPKGGNFKILSGAEVNILKNGSLDIKDAILAKLDVVGIAVHSHFNLPRAEQTARVARAMRNKNADILFHPTGRLIHKREPIDIDIDEIIKTAKETGTALEIDAEPSRLDLKDEYIRKAVNAGVKLAIDTDAHSVKGLHNLEFGIGQARRGWATKNDVINTRSWPEMLKFLK